MTDAKITVAQVACPPKTGPDFKLGLWYALRNVKSSVDCAAIY